MNTMAAGWPSAAGICALLAGLLTVFGGLLVGLSYIFAVAVIPVLRRRDPIRSCALFTEIDDEKRSYRFAVPFALCTALAVATIGAAVIGSVWIVAAGAATFLCAVPALTLLWLVPLNRAMATCVAAGQDSTPIATEALRRWRTVNLIRFWGGFIGLILVAVGAGTPMLSLP
jgi:uncharacterized membrane protein